VEKQEVLHILCVCL